MHQSSHTCVYKATAVSTRVRAKWKSLQLAWEKRGLESKLEKDSPLCSGARIQRITCRKCSIQIASNPCRIFLPGVC